MSLKILVVDDDETLRLTLKSTLQTRKYEVDEAVDGLEACEKVIKQGPYDAVILDVNMPKMSGLEALSKIKSIAPQTFCIILTAYADLQNAIQAIKQGAYDYLEKPVNSEKILNILDAALTAKDMVEIAGYSAPELKISFENGKDIIGNSQSIKQIFDIIYKLSKVDTSVLIRGESGTGKELVAKAIHYNSHRKKGPFVAVNCAAIPEELIESELFGHEKGAFTGADRKKIGKFQYAASGTLFLDEIGDISPSMQVKLLRVLQEKTFTPVGSNQELVADVRIIAATNRNLEELMTQKKFREDLYYRLNVLPIILPPLKQRKEDIEMLVNYLIKKFNNIHGRNIKGIDKIALHYLKQYNWPGNIRELENIIERAFILESSNIITIASLPDNIINYNNSEKDISNLNITSDKTLDISQNMHELQNDVKNNSYLNIKEEFEKKLIIEILKNCKGKINKTAEQAKMSKVTLIKKLEKYSINPDNYK